MKHTLASLLDSGNIEGVDVILKRETEVMHVLVNVVAAVGNATGLFVAAGAAEHGEDHVVGAGFIADGLRWQGDGAEDEGQDRGDGCVEHFVRKKLMAAWC